MRVLTTMILGAIGTCGVAMLGARAQTPTPAQPRPGGEGGAVILQQAPTDKTVSIPLETLKGYYTSMDAKKQQTLRMLEGGVYNVNIRRITAAETALVHPKTTDVWVVTEGAGMLTTGGQLVNGKIVGGETHAIKPGDVEFIPAGVPHGVSGVKSSITWLNIRFDTVAGTGSAAAPASASQTTDDELAARLLKGAFDIHAHIDPDSFGPNSAQAARAIDVNDLAKLAKDRGMRGFVAKMHYDTTAHLVYVLRKAVPGVEIFGLVGSNRSMGGVNPVAVAHMAEVKGGWGRVVNMPTWDAEYFVKNGRTPNRPFVSVSKNGELLPEVKEVIAIMAKTKTRDSNGQMVLYTGHNAPAESLLMVREAARLGVPVLVSHPLIEFVDMPLPMMEEAAKLGAYLEIVSGWATGKDVEHEMHEHVQAIRKIGVEHFVLSSDRGQLNGPLHPDGLVTVAKALMKGGITEQEIDRMLKENPARLFGLPPASTNNNGVR